MTYSTFKLFRSLPNRNKKINMIEFYLFHVTLKFYIVCVIFVYLHETKKILVNLANYIKITYKQKNKKHTREHLL